MPTRETRRRTARIAIPTALCVPLVAFKPVPTWTLGPPTACPPVCQALIRHGDEAHASLDPLGALALYQRALVEDSTSYEALWRASREAVHLGMLANDGENRRRRAEEAVTYARRAMVVEPSGVEGPEWLSIALGRLALEQGPRTRARMSVEIREAALSALALDSLSAGAHHVLGEWHAEIRRLSGLERWAARKLLGVDVIGDASWEDAVGHLERAVALAPDVLVHRLDLARAYLDVGRKEEARRELREVLDRPVTGPVDPLQKESAQRLLGKM